MLIGLCGKARSGKDTIADYLVNEYGFQKKTFAAPLKALVKDLFDFDDDQINGGRKEEIDGRYGVTPRHLLQKVGTDWFRSVYDRVWVDKLLRGLDSSVNTVVSDVRFLNEVKAINRAGGCTIRVVRENHAGASGGIKGHKSESEIDSIPPECFAATFRAGSGCIDQLYEMTNNFIELRRNRTSSVLKTQPVSLWSGTSEQTVVSKYGENPMSLDEYRRLSRSVESTPDQYTAAQSRLTLDLIRVLHMTIGIAGESGELIDAVKRAVFYGKPLDRCNIVEELGDLLWYMDGLCDVLNVGLDDVMAKNVAKLQERYKNGFSEKAAIDRSIGKEKAAMKAAQTRRDIMKLRDRVLAEGGDNETE